MSIKDLIDWTIDRGNELFADTRYSTTWWIYHDALAQWWEKSAQEHIKARGFEFRQWRADDTINAQINRRYRNRLMGDSPELMPLDSSLFGDLIEKVAWLVVATGQMGDNKYSMATPDKAWKTMVDAWELVPEARIRQDVGRFVTALDAIIAAEGAYVADMDLRNGHRREMQRLVRGGALREGNSAARAATIARVQAGLQEAMAKWAGISANLAG